MKHLIYWCFFLFPLPAYLQTTCGEAVYRQILQDANRSFGDGDFRQAYEKYRAARGCMEADFKLIDSLMDATLAAVDQQRERAQRAEKNALRNLAKANRLVAYFNFGDENAAWAYNTQNGRFGVIDRNGKLLSKPGFIYESPESFRKGIATALVNNQFVFVNDQGVEVSERYDYLLPTLHDRFVAGSKTIKMMLNNEGGPLYEINTDLGRTQMNPFTIIEKGGKKGLLDSNGRIIVVPQYDKIENFFEGMAAVCKNDKWGFIDTTGTEKISPQYEGFFWFTEGRAAVSKNRKKWGFVSKSGTELIPFQYDFVWPFSNGIAKVRRNGKWEIIDVDGAVLIPSQHEGLEDFLQNLFTIQTNEKPGYIDSTGTLLVPWKYLRTKLILDSLLIIEKNQKFGLADQTGKIMNPPCYDEIKNISSHRAAVRKGRLWGVVNSKGFEIIKPQFHNVYSSFLENLVVENLQKCRLVDSTGLVISDMEFDQIGFFSEGLASIKKNGKWGFINEAGNVTISPEFDDVEAFHGGVTKVNKENKPIFIDRKGTEMTLELYTEIGPITKNLAAIQKGIMWGFVDKEGRYIAKPQFNEAGYASKNRIGVRINGLWGLYDYTGKEIIPSRYDQMILNRGMGASFIEILDWEKNDFNLSLESQRFDGQDEGAPILVRKANAWGIIDSSGREIVAPEYDEICPFSEGLAKVRKDAKWGFVDTEGKMVIPLLYEDVMDFSGGLTWVNIGATGRQFGKALGGHWAISDKKGNLIIVPRSYQEVGNFCFGFAPFKKDQKWGLVNKVGQEIMPPIFDGLGIFTNNLLWINQMTPCFTDNTGKEIIIAGNRTLCDLFGFIDSTGKILSVPQYQLISELSDGRIRVAKSKKYGFVDSSGTEVIPAIYAYCNDFSEGLAVVLMEKKWGVIDKFGRAVVPFRYDRIEQFSSGLALVQQKGLCGYIDKKGREVIPVRYAAVEAPTDGLIKVNKDGKWGLTDLQGRIVLPCQYQLYRCGYRQYLLEQNGRWGLFAPEHGIHIEPAYEAIGYVGEELGWIRVKQNDKWGWVDAQGQTMIPCRFAAATPFADKHARVFQSPYLGSFYINTKGEMILGYNGPK